MGKPSGSLSLCLGITASIAPDDIEHWHVSHFYWFYQNGESVQVVWHTYTCLLACRIHCNKSPLLIQEAFKLLLGILLVFDTFSHEEVILC
jgi:hypothetical protein